MKQAQTKCKDRCNVVGRKRKDKAMVFNQSVTVIAVKGKVENGGITEREGIKKE